MFKAEALVAVALLATLSLAASPAPIPRPSTPAENQGPKQSTRHLQATNNSQQPANLTPTPPPRGVKLQTNQTDATSQGHEKHNQGIDWPTWIEAVGAFITAIFTGLLFVATYRLWNSTKGLYEETKRLAAGAEAQSADIKAQIKATEDMATAAQKSADLAERALTAIERPYVYPKNVFAIGKDRTIQFSVVNHGRLPAVVRTVWAKMVHSIEKPIRDSDLGNATSWSLHSAIGTGQDISELNWRIDQDWATDVTKLTFVPVNWEGTESVVPNDLPAGETLYFRVRIFYTGPGNVGPFETSSCWRVRIENGGLIQLPECAHMT